MKELFALRRNQHDKGSVIFKWDPTCKYLATCGQNRRVHIYERNGESYHEFALTGAKSAIMMDWDKDGETLAVLQDGCSIVPLWNVHEKKVKELETNLKDPSFMCWSRVGPQLAIGTAKGNLLIYNNQTFKSMMMAGKHSKKITCGQWNLENKLALASQDKMMTISDEKGELLEQAKLKYDPFDIQFAEQKVDEKQNTKENTVSINMGHQTILMYNMTDTDNPVELAFQLKYGEIASYRWFGDGYMMVGFSKGYVISISTHMKEIGEELQSLKIHEIQLYDVVYSQLQNKLATCGDDGVRIVDMGDWKELKSEHRDFSKEDGIPEKMEWTRDGQILTVSTNGGCVFNFLMSIPVLAAYQNTRIGYLSSLRSVCVLDATSLMDGVDKRDAVVPPVTIEIAVEPSFMAVGPAHVAVGMNNHCWFYSTTSPNQQINFREYLGTVDQIVMNESYAAVLCDGKIHLHLIIPNTGDDHDSRLFPEKEDSSNTITSIQMTSEFLIYSTQRGTIHHFAIKEWAAVNEYKHDVAIRAVFANTIGTRVVFIDANNRGYLYSPVDDHRVEISNFPPSIESIVWDPMDPHVFVAVDAKLHRNIVTFVYMPQTTRGPQVVKVGNTKVPNGFSSIMLYDGVMHGQKASGMLQQIPLATHDAIVTIFGKAPHARRSSDKLRQALTQLLALNRLKQAWDLALTVKSKESWISLARKAMETLDIDLCIRVYREMRDTAMVLALQDIQYLEDKHLLAGHICLLNQDYNRAQNLFLNSSSEITALQMRRDLLHWDHALKLADKLAKDQIPAICREYAQSLEVKGEYAQALQQYMESLKTVGNQKHSEEHMKSSTAGIARMTLRTGDLQKGRTLALQSNDKLLMKDCAQILENMKQYTDAADMYVQAEQYEKAASIYIQTKNFAKAGPLMDKITTPKLHAQYAKAKEAEKAYAEAAAAYERARDMDSVVRLNLQFLDNPSKAFSIVRQSKSSEGAAMVATYCQQHRDFQSAIEFMLMAKRSEEAFKLAQNYNEMEKYAKALGDDGTHEEYLNIAVYYEEHKEYAKAAHYYSLVGDHSKAMKLYLQCGDTHIDDAINVVKKANGQPGSELLVRMLHDFLIGETDGKVKDLNFVFRLYMAIGQYSEAASTAILIATTDQKLGNYNVAHGILFDTHQDLIAHQISIPSELRRNLLLLHSYILAKKLAQKADHESAARMLIRVAKNISKFPTHVVNILTSTVIECQRAGLKRSSFEYASMLMRAEYRNNVDKKYRKQIEAIVRRPANEERDERLSACPYCQFELPETLLDCPSCKNALPYCITTGRHMVLDDWTFCPACRFPTLYSAFVARINTDKTCAMCNQNIQLSAINKVDDPRSLLMKSQDDEQKQNATSTSGEL